MGSLFRGSNVYVLGEADIVYPNQSNPYTLTNPTYWKNGTPVNISASIPYISTFSGSIAADDNNLYIVGAKLAPRNSAIGIYLKNNDVVPVTDTNQFSTANSIAIKGNDVYIAGATSPANAFEVATYWKNGIMTRFDGPLLSQANDIAVNGNDIYIAGIIAENNVFMATYWKNGTAIRLSNSSATADAIAVNGSDVYVAGSNSLGAVYWKNSVAVQLGKGVASDIVVVPR